MIFSFENFEISDVNIPSLKQAELEINHCLESKFQNMWDTYTKQGHAKMSFKLFPKVKPNSDLFILTGKYHWFWGRLHTGHGPWRESLFKKKLVEDDRCLACREKGVIVDGEVPIENIDHIFTCESCPKKCAARAKMVVVVVVSKE